MMCIRELIKRWAQVEYLIDHWGSDDDEYFSKLVWEKYELEQKIAALWMNGGNQDLPALSGNKREGYRIY